MVGARRHAVGNNGDHFAVTRRCRHPRADLVHRSIDTDGCQACPWHQSKHDVHTGRMTPGPQGIFAQVPGLGPKFIALTKLIPLRRGKVERRGPSIVVN